MGLSVSRGTASPVLAVSRIKWYLCAGSSPS
uniref:Uncharacterized protein n=1 Tax=Siphoviridae sp. ctBLh2 TaxID=2827803 RepID=A0A8S5S482_9CAUD|nr:MAG TPA: hypothetical protein [Siphoviridae sp. ctBLh2]